MSENLSREDARELARALAAISMVLREITARWVVDGTTKDKGHYKICVEADDLASKMLTKLSQPQSHGKQPE